MVRILAKGLFSFRLVCSETENRITFTTRTVSTRAKRVFGRTLYELRLNSYFRRPGRKLRRDLMFLRPAEYLFDDIAV